MRRINLSALCLLIAFAVSAQSYVPITTAHSKWLYQHTSPWGDHSWWGMEIGPDTVIAGDTYQKQDGFAWRDVSGKVWCRAIGNSFSPTLDSVPILMYDFTLQVGDTFHFPLDTTWSVVASRDSLQMLNGTYRNRINFTNWSNGVIGCSNGSWIEGFGDPGFVLFPIVDCFELGMNLECYGINNVPLFGSCMWLSEEESKPPDRFEVFPNPAYDFVELRGPTSTIHSLTLFDLTGRQRGLWIGTRSRIDLGGLSAGTYLLRIRSSDGDHVLRLMLARD